MILLAFLVIKVRETRVLVIVVPILAPIIIGIADSRGRMPLPAIPTIREVVADEL